VVIVVQVLMTLVAWALEPITVTIRLDVRDKRMNGRHCPRVLSGGKVECGRHVSAVEMFRFMEIKPVPAAHLS